MRPNNMELQLSTTFIFFLSTTLFLSTTITGQPPPSNDTNTEFIRTNCESTRYPDTCFTSLSNYSSAIQQDSGRLARVAIHVALHNATHMANYVSNISRQAADNSITNTTRESAAINDCSSLFEDAVDEIEKSKMEMKRLGNSTGESVKFQLSNVQTWMSAALTNEDTCTDGFQKVEEGEMKKDVCDRVGEVKKVTSNALALVNSYADKISA